MYSSVTSACALTAPASGEASISSVFIHGESAAAEFNRMAIGANSAVGGTATPEKFNSRSPASASTLNVASSLSPTVIYYSYAGFTHNAWRKSHRAVLRFEPSAVKGITIDFSITNPSSTMLFDEAAMPGLRRLRRSTKSAAWPLFGNQIAHYQKTGGGAYSIKAPNFDNDVTWIEPSAWRNGMSQNEVWEINAFGIAPPGPPAPNVSQAVQRAANW